jgi:hypothetical protein
MASVRSLAPLVLHMRPLGRYEQCASSHKIGITHSIQPEERREYEYLPKEKLPGHYSSYATDEEHQTLHELSVVELSKAADE